MNLGKYSRLWCPWLSLLSSHLHSETLTVPSSLSCHFLRSPLRRSALLTEGSIFLWSSGADRLGLPKGSAEGSTKVPARMHQGSSKVLQVSWCLWLSGADPFWAAQRFRLKGSVENSPIASLNLSPSSSTLFAFFPNSTSIWGLQP